MASVTIIAGSKSDEGLVRKIEEVLDELGATYESHIASAHRDPEKVEEIIRSSEADVFIGVAGLSAALPGVIASRTVKPVIGVPRDVKLNGLDALLSIAQMPPGVPVATVGVDNARNAAILAVEILALKDSELGERLAAYRRRG
ncbi:MAG: 5-(carboxyamino)imidazole ribonucleotide mutase [Methanobacteriota archaeon]|nr:MAG: 5-(carboxyamino)imidazole ribonucleotide mutase [Euryarchaeota archaeon]